MALTIEAWHALLELAVGLEGAAIWLPIGDLRPLGPKLWEVRFCPDRLRQGRNQGTQVQFDERLEGARVVCRMRGGGLAWEGVIRTVLPGEGAFTLAITRGRSPEQEPINVYPPAYLATLFEQVGAWRVELGDDLDARLQARLGRPAPDGGRWPGVEVGAESRERQRAALGLTGSPLAVVWGPPGTGKTATLAGMVTRLVLGGERVLVTAPTRIAADGACLAVDQALTAAGHPRRRGDVLRTAVPQKADRFTAQRPDLLVWSDEERGHRERLVALQRADEEGRRRLLMEVGTEYDAALVAAADRARSLEAMQDRWKARVRTMFDTAQVVVATVRQAQAHGWPAEFAHLIVDEGSMVPVSDGMALFLHQEIARGGGSMVVIGDPRQLPPIGLRAEPDDDENAEGQAAAIPTTLQEAHATWLMQSFQGFLMETFEGRVPVVMLNEQSRMNVDLCAVVSAKQYGGDLHPTSSAPAPGVSDWLPAGICVLNPEATPSWLQPTLRETPRPAPPKFPQGSTYQTTAAQASVALARFLTREGVEVLLCSPYRAQAGLLRRGVADLPAVRAGTVHRVQGEQAEVAIFDPAIASNWFIRQSAIAPLLVNVAVSRAGRALVLSNGPLYLRLNPLLVPYLEAAKIL